MWLAEGISIAIMELVMNWIDYLAGGVQAGSVFEPIFWFGLLVSIPPRFSRCLAGQSLASKKRAAGRPLRWLGGVLVITSEGQRIRFLIERETRISAPETRPSYLKNLNAAETIASGASSCIRWPEPGISMKSQPGIIRASSDRKSVV